MPKYKHTAITSKEGINFVRSMVESAGSLFMKIEQENDLGIDALVEFIRDERPLNKIDVAGKVREDDIRSVRTKTMSDAKVGERIHCR